MRRLITRLAFVMSLFGCAATISATSVADELQRADLETYLEHAWSVKPEERTQATSYFDELIQRVGPDRRLGHARVLATIKQRQYADALKFVNSLTAVENPKPELLRAKVWLAVLLKNYGQAAVAADKLALVLPPIADPPADDESDYEDFARFLGRVQGFLDGPAADGYPEGQRAALRKKVLDSLKGERKVAYLEGRDAVLEQFLALTDEKEVRREKSKEEGERERDERLTALNETREQASQRGKELDSRNEKLRSELNDELSQLQKQDAPLARRYTQLDVQGTSLRREMALVDSERIRFETLLARERDPNLRASYIREIARLDALFARYDVDFAAIARQASGVAAQRAELDRRAAQARANLGQQIDSAERELGDLNRKARRADAEERRLKTKNVGENNSGVLAKAAQAAAFTTYEQFPLEEQRQALLNSFK